MCTILAYDPFYKLTTSRIPGAYWILEAAGDGRIRHGQSEARRCERRNLPHGQRRFSEALLQDLHSPAACRLQQHSRTINRLQVQLRTTRALQSRNLLTMGLSRTTSSARAVDAPEATPSSSMCIGVGWRLESEPLCHSCYGSGPHRGQRRATFVCTIKDSNDTECGAKCSVWHLPGKPPSNSNLHFHISKQGERCSNLESQGGRTSASAQSRNTLQTLSSSASPVTHYGGAEGTSCNG